MTPLSDDEAITRMNVAQLEKENADKDRLIEKLKRQLNLALEEIAKGPRIDSTCALALDRNGRRVEPDMEKHPTKCAPVREAETPRGFVLPASPSGADLVTP